MTWAGPGGRGLRSDHLVVASSWFVQEYHVLTPQEDIIFVLRGGPLDLEVGVLVLYCDDMDWAGGEGSPL